MLLALILIPILATMLFNKIVPDKEFDINMQLTADTFIMTVEQDGEIEVFVCKEGCEVQNQPS